MEEWGTDGIDEFGADGDDGTVGSGSLISKGVSVAEEKGADSSRPGTAASALEVEGAVDGSEASAVGSLGGEEEKAPEALAEVFQTAYCLGDDDLESSQIDNTNFWICLHTTCADLSQIR